VLFLIVGVAEIATIYIALSKNMKVCEKELSNIGGGGGAQDTAQLSLWSIGGGELWSRVRKGTRDLAPKFSDIGEKATEMVLPCL